MSNLRPALVLAAVLVVQALPRPASAGEAELKAAHELVRVITSKAAYEDMMKQLTQNMIAGMGGPGTSMPPELSGKFQAAMADALPYEELMTWSAEVYARRFSTAELKELAKFYKTPLGLKVARQTPEIMGEVGRKIGELLPSRMPAALERAGLKPPSAGR